MSGMNVAHGAIALGAITGGLIGKAMSDFASNNSYSNAAIEQALENAADITVLARHLGRELAAAHAENAALKRALAQREAYIDRMRS